MSKTFKLSGIMLFSVMGLQVMRILSSLLPLSDNISGWLFSFIMQCLFLGLFPYLLYKATIKDGDFLKDIRVKAKVHPLSYLLAIVIGFLTYGVNSGASTIWYLVLSSLGFTYVRGGGVLFTSPEVIVLEIITSCMLPAIFEEITDRGILLACLDDVKNDTLKIIAVGLFFGACHQNAPQLGPTALAGVIIGFMAVKSGSILPGMIVHFMNNFIITISGYFSQKGIVVPIFSKIEELLFMNGLTTLLAGAVCGVVLIFVLRFFAILNEKPENRKLKTNVEDTIASVYGIGYNGARSSYQTNATPPSPLSVTKAKRSDYLLLVLAFLSAFAVTVFTFFWGLLR